MTHLVPKLLLGHAHVFEALLRPRGAEARCQCQIAPREAELRGQVRSQAGACGTRSAGERGQDGVKGDKKMPSYGSKMSDEEIKALVTYIRTLKK